LLAVSTIGLVLGCPRAETSRAAPGRGGGDAPGAAVKSHLAGLRSTDWCERFISAERLAARAKAWAVWADRVVPALLKALGDRDPAVRKAAARALARGGKPAAAAILAAIKHPQQRIRWRVAWVLGKIRHRPAVPALVAALGDEKPSVRRAAAGSLGWIGDRRAVAPLIQRLRDPVDDVRAAAATALSALKGRRAFKALEGAVKDADRKVQKAVIEGLTSFRRQRRKVARLLRRRLRRGSAVARAAAARGLGRIKDRRAVRLLIRAIEDSSVSVRKAAVAALGEIGDRRAIRPLKRAWAKLREGSIRYAMQRPVFEAAFKKLGIGLPRRSSRRPKPFADAVGSIGESDGAVAPDVAIGTRRGHRLNVCRRRFRRRPAATAHASRESTRFKTRIRCFVPPPRLPRSQGSRVRNRIRAKVYGLRTCHQRHTSGETLSVQMTFHITKRGRVEQPKITVGGEDAAGMRRCIRRKIARWRLGRISRRLFFGPFTVRFKGER